MCFSLIISIYAVMNTVDGAGLNVRPVARNRFAVLRKPSV